MSKYVKKLGEDNTYNRPKTTYQEQLSANEIGDKLQGYEKVDNIAEVPLNTHIRYFTTKPDGTQVFRMGGFLYNKQNSKIFVLSGFYDINIDKEIYYSINMIDIVNNNLELYHFNKIVFKSKLDEIKDFNVYYHYRTLKFKLIKYLSYLFIYFIVVYRIILTLVH